MKDFSSITNKHFAPSMHIYYCIYQSHKCVIDLVHLSLYLRNKKLKRRQPKI